MDYSKVKIKGEVDLEIYLCGEKTENHLLFFLAATCGAYPISDPVCCIVTGDAAKTVIEAAVKKKQLQITGSIRTTVFEDNRTHRFYNRSYVSVDSAEIVEISDQPVMETEAYGRLHHVKRHKDRDGDIYYTFVLSAGRFYDDERWFNCTAYGKTGEELCRCYEADPYELFKLTGVVAPERLPSRKGMAHMYVHAFEETGERV